MSVSMLETLDNAEGEAVDDVKTMADLPPEILTKLLEYLLDGDRYAELSYRLVNSQWKSIMDRLLEEKLISTWLHPLPQLKLTQSFCVNVPPSIVPGNPFPFKSLFLRGSKDRNTHCVPYGVEESNADPEDEGPDSESQEKAISLQEFATAFGGNLTIFALYFDVIDSLQIHFSLLTKVLGSMPCLKRLSLSNVVLEWPLSVGSPTPPPLPSLSDLELVCPPGYRQSYSLYLWLVAVYADQLVRLNLIALETDPFLPLLKQHKYHVNLNYMKYFIATSSDAAFKKLKELKVYLPTQEFLRFSETPALQHFSVIGLPYYRIVMLGDFMKFMASCGDGLQTVFVNANWSDWNRRRLRGLIEQDQLEEKVCNLKVPNLKKFTIPFPEEDRHKMLLYKNLLTNFPRLEVLQLIRFDTEMVMVHAEEAAVELETDGDVDYEERALLQQQLTSLAEQETLIQGELDAQLLSELGEVKKRRISAQKRSMRCRHFLGAVQRRLHFQRKEEQTALKQQIEINKNETAALRQRLDVLNRKVTIARELQEYEIWSSCPKLKVVSVSSDASVSGDICVLKRTNGGLS